MSAPTFRGTGPSEAAILARVLVNDQVEMSAEAARYLLTLEFSEEDKARMHELAVQNQADMLSANEKEELFAYSRAGTLLSILKVRARRALKSKPHKRLSS